jgi:3'(2'), 5'-bisphosphate nucleotidase
MESLDAEFARWLAASAGELLLNIRSEMGFADPAALRRAGDLRSHEYLAAQLAGWRPDDAVLSEEALGSRSVDASAARLDASRVWIIDPLDGTREYAEEGRSDWAVHVALWTSEPVPAQARRRRRTVHSAAPPGGRLAAGVIALPAQGAVLSSDTPPAPPPDAQARGTRLRIACSRTRPPAFLARLAEEMDAVLIPMGSAGAKIAAVITGEVDAYVHAGLHTSRLDGTPLRYNQADPLLPDLVVCRSRISRTLLAAIAAVESSPEPVSGGISGAVSGPGPLTDDAVPRSDIDVSPISQSD